ncbi:MAG: PAQR family membrane homeostasis protein TrhA [Maritimibacter sp.]
MERYGLDHSLSEHIADGVMHVLGVVFAVAAVTAMIVWASLRPEGLNLAPVIPYAIGLVATFSFSAAYNMTLHARLRPVLRRFDHAAIYVMIAGTYTPMALVGVGGREGALLVVAVWSMALIGVALKLFLFERFTKIGLALYLMQGWLCVLAAGPLMSRLPPAALWLLVIGGVVYTFGTLIFHFRWPFVRAVWHGHVLVGTAVHYAAVMMILRLA